MANGFHVSTPVSESIRYDAIVDSGSSLKRIQVKSARTLKKGRKYEYWSLGVTGYSHGDFDYMAFYSYIRDCWWIIPSEVCLRMKSLNFRDTGEISLYREAWHLLK